VNGPNPLAFPSLYDYAMVSGLRTPGLAIVTTPGRSQDFDKKKGKGTLGATSTFQGWDLADVVLDVRIWRTPRLLQDFDDLAAIRAVCVIDPTKRLEVRALAFQHPSTTECGIVAVVCTKMGPTVKLKGGLTSTKFAFEEYRPAPKVDASGTPTGADQKAKGGRAARARLRQPRSPLRS
jgi:hypothetical protein